MEQKWKIECVMCKRKESFGDAKDIIYAHWKILAWNIGSAEPICECDKCEYKPYLVNGKIKENDKEKLKTSA